ncbi:MAG: ABC transporter permease [Hungatella hathewayi]
MSVSARTRQYGALRAIGMSSRQLVLMVTAEAASYAVCGSITGCAVGLPLHKYLYETMVTAQWGEPWTLPIHALSAIVLIVLVTAIVAVLGPVRRIHAMSIVDTINAT